MIDILNPRLYIKEQKQLIKKHNLDPYQYEEIMYESRRRYFYFLKKKFDLDKIEDLFSNDLQDFKFLLKNTYDKDLRYTIIDRNP